MVGTGRFELPTPRTPSECATRLSHIPTRLRRRRAEGVIHISTAGGGVETRAGEPALFLPRSYSGTLNVGTEVAVPTLKSVVPHICRS